MMLSDVHLGPLLAKAATYAKVSGELQTSIGWLCLAFALLVFSWVWTRAESVRRSLLALEDPRTFAILRIGFALMTIQCFWNLHPYWRMLWSDEGLFTLEEARQRLGGTALQGWAPGEGFFDVWALLRYLWGKHSIFYFYGSPAFVEAYLFAFFGVLLLYAAGVCSRVTGVIAWLMMGDIYNRNALYLEGTDTVYRVFWFLLLFCKTGHAWSVDNWLRCWWLRRKGRLADPDDPAPAEGMQPVYRLVPAWPRYLMMAQLVGIYMSTGMVKTGSVWAAGDAFYYALNMDHFYRFEVYTQMVSAMFATTLFRVMTWVTHWWEMGFFFAALGMLLKFGLEHRREPWYRRQHRGLRKWLGRLALAGAYGITYLVTVVSVPYCVEQLPDEAKMAARVEEALLHVHLGFGVALPLLVLAWYIVGVVPLRVIKPGKRLTLAGRTLSLPTWTIDQEWMRGWLLGRRLWLTLGLLFHGTLILFMNIGMFPFIMLMTYAAWFRGDEYVKAFRGCAAWLRRRGLGRLAPPRVDAWLAPAARPEHVAKRGRKIPDLAVLLLGALAVGVLYLRIDGARKDIEDYVYAWIGLCLLVGLACLSLRARKRRPSEDELGGGPGLAYSPLGRTVALLFVLWHGGSVLSILLPGYPVFAKWRSPMRGFFTGWNAGTDTSQSWRMFAPNPPRSNTFMKTIVVEYDGSRWDLQNNSYALRPDPWIWNDRMRKMQRRMVGKGKWYLKHWAAFHCREWYLQTGRKAYKIDVKRLSTRIPTPEQVTSRGWYKPRNLKPRVNDVQSHRCPDGGELPLFMKERYGLPITDEDRERAAREDDRELRRYKSRRETWERRRTWFGKQRERTPVATPPSRAAAAVVQSDTADEDGE